MYHLKMISLLIHLLLSQIISSFLLNIKSVKYDNPKCILQMNTKIEIKPREFRNLKPIPSIGVYSPSSSECIPSFYLGPDRMVCQQRNDNPNTCIVRGIVPVPIPVGYDSALQAAIPSSDSKTYGNNWSGQLITDRNGGLYDSLKQTFIWASQPQARRAIYESLRLKSSCISPYHGIIDAIDRFADLKLCGLLVELADSPSEYTYTLGAAILVAKGPVADKWKLTYKQTTSIKAVRGSDEAQLVKCTMDELVGIAFASQLPVVISSKLYESTAIDGLFEQDPITYKISTTAPYFNSVQEEKLWKLEQSRREKEILNRQSKAAKRVPKVSEISDASTFLSYKTSEKRAILRYSGVYDLPRPREGKRAVDALMIPLLDEEVAYEVLRRLAETKGDFEAASQMNDFESRKPMIARQIMEAKKNGDEELAKTLCDELNSLSTLRFDPTNPDLRGEWDVEEWYWEQRKRIYGIIAA